MQLKQKLFFSFATLALLCFAGPLTVSAQENYLNKYQALQLLWTHFDLQVDSQYLSPNETWEQYWQDIWPGNSMYGIINTACKKRVLTCDPQKFFDGESPMSGAAFLKLLYTMKWQGDTALAQSRLNPFQNFVWYVPYQQEAIQTGLIDRNFSLEMLRYGDAMEILRRDSVLSNYGDTINTYFYGLEIAPADITLERYYSSPAMQQAIQAYYDQIAQLTKMSSVMSEGAEKQKYQAVIERLYSLQRKMIEVEQIVAASPLLYDPSVPEEIRQAAREQGIREKVGESTYDFSQSPSYRRYNIKTALNKINGTVLQPGEEFNFYQKIYDNRLREFKLGWVILQGKEQQAIGGGICGAATTIFEAAYRSGLEITERREHSIFYRSFYPMEKIGLDAAVYGTRPNLRFVNNTGAPLLLYLTYPSENVANLQVWGTKNFDALTLEGPNWDKRTTRWIRTIWYKDGSKTSDEIKSRFGRVV